MQDPYSKGCDSVIRSVEALLRQNEQARSYTQSESLVILSAYGAVVFQDLWCGVFRPIDSPCVFGIGFFECLAVNFFVKHFQVQKEMD